MKTPAATKVTTSAPTKRKFTGTDNPRHLRVIATLLYRPISEEELDSLAGSNDGLELVEELRRLGLDAPCKSISFTDLDGQPCCPDVYSLTPRDCRVVRAWLARRNRQIAKVVCDGQ